MSAYEVASDTGVLDQMDVKILAKHASEDLKLEGKKVLLIIPDNTRTCPLNMVLGAINWAFKPKVEKLDMLIASPDIVAADSYAASLFGMKPDDLAYIQAGTAMGLGRSDLNNLKIEELTVGG